MVSDDATETALAGGAELGGNDDGNGTPYGVGLAAGLAAWVLGYLVFYVAYASDIRNSLAGEALNALTDGGGTWRAVGWYFFNGHAVSVTTDIPIVGTNAVTFLPEGAVLPYLVAPVLLLVAGLLVGSRAGTDGVGDAAVTGLLVVPGYFALSLVGVFLFAISTENASVAPDPVTGILLAGLVYPAVFGAVGALVGDRL
jgi:uncharacterized membrane protein (GlpM family)